MFNSLVWQTFTMLRRDRIFFPAIASATVLLFILTFISDLAIEEPDLLFYDTSFTLINLTGITVAILWGTSVIGDSKFGSEINQQLAAPISRHQWLVAKYIGLALTITAFCALLIILWSLFVAIEPHIPFLPGHLVIFGVQLILWLTIAACAVMISCTSSQLVAIFAVSGIAIIGLVLQPVSQILDPSEIGIAQSIVLLFAKVWNLQNFNLTQFSAWPDKIPLPLLLIALLQGTLSIAGFLAAATLLFRKKDLV